MAVMVEKWIIAMKLGVENFKKKVCIVKNDPFSFPSNNAASLLIGSVLSISHQLYHVGLFPHQAPRWASFCQTALLRVTLKKKK